MKIILTSALALLFATSFAQNFHPNALVIDAGGGLEVYNTKLNVHNSLSGKDTMQTDKTGNGHFYFAAEYGLHKYFGAGLMFRSDNYFVGKDTAGNKTQGSAKGTEFLLQMNFHPYSKKAVDLVLGADAGYSKLNLNNLDNKGTNVWGTGMFYSFYFNPRFYFGRFGLNFKIYSPFFKYPKLTSNNPDFTKDQSYKFSGIPGWGFNAGLQYRLFSERGARGERRGK